MQFDLLRKSLHETMYAGKIAVELGVSEKMLLNINTTCQSITQHSILYRIKIVYCQGDMFRPVLGHL